ncbi:hypothetical protein BJ508DRAFT_18491 [Ascobolus immersus RN42]|uniref:Uncharacterized protein n=1 Tax=Ascobolus immersus RN42 TaxID=1160509 RepID=A0A3N4HP42_ASCIM|nr:hypothetical protein BJ508DRAFT_18491 [Ascobolus immersus RN42]
MTCKGRGGDKRMQSGWDGSGLNQMVMETSMLNRWQEGQQVDESGSLSGWQYPVLLAVCVGRPEISDFGGVWWGMVGYYEARCSKEMWGPGTGQLRPIDYAMDGNSGTSALVAWC